MGADFKLIVMDVHPLTSNPFVIPTEVEESLISFHRGSINQRCLDFARHDKNMFSGKNSIAGKILAR
jgi:hypothetical protein